MNIQLFFKFILVLIGINQLHYSLNAISSQKDKQLIIITNKTNNPIIANAIVERDREKKAGFYGLLIPSNKTQHYSFDEFYWFEKQAIGGFKKPEASSQVKIIEVLNHSFANFFEIIIPNNTRHQIPLESNNIEVVIENDTTIKIINESLKKHTHCKVLPGEFKKQLRE